MNGLSVKKGSLGFPVVVSILNYSRNVDGGKFVPNLSVTRGRNSIQFFNLTVHLTNLTGQEGTSMSNPTLRLKSQSRFDDWTFGRRISVYYEDRRTQRFSVGLFLGIRL